MMYMFEEDMYIIKGISIMFSIATVTLKLVLKLYYILETQGDTAYPH